MIWTAFILALTFFLAASPVARASGLQRIEVPAGDGFPPLKGVGRAAFRRAFDAKVVAFFRQNLTDRRRP